MTNPTPVITELRIEGFKSFGTPMQRLPLGRLNFVVGANASGKTNLISALQFLQTAVLQNVEYAVNEMGGIAEVRNKIVREKNVKKPLVMGFKIDMGEMEVITDPDEHIRIVSYDYMVRIDLRNETKLPLIEQEILLASARTRDNRSLKFELRRDKQNVEITDHITPTSTQDVQRYSVPSQDATRLALGVGFFNLPCAILRSLIEEWRFYNISPPMARLPFKETPDVDLGSAGENLAVILHKLEQQNGKGALNSVITGLKSAVPGFRGIKTTRLPVEGKWAFQVLEDKISGAINPDSVSDGTIRLLALMVIATWKGRQPSLIAIEEPENGVHPHLSEHIVEILRKSSEDRQLLVTTHNPEFLNYTEPDEVILCDKNEGFTVLKRASDIVEIEKFREHYRIGELWMQGTLGGIP